MPIREEPAARSPRVHVRIPVVRPTERALSTAVGTGRVCWSIRLDGGHWDLAALVGLGEEHGRRTVTRDHTNLYRLEFEADCCDPLDAYAEAQRRLAALNQQAAEQLPSFRPVRLVNQITNDAGGHGQLV